MAGTGAGGEDWELLQELEGMDEEVLEAAIAREEAALAGLGGGSGGGGGDGAAPAPGAGGAPGAIGSPPGTALPGPATPRSSPPTETELQAELARLEHENTAMKKELVTGTGLSALDSRDRSAAGSKAKAGSDLDSALAASMARRKRMVSASGGAADLARAVAEAEARLDVKQRGVDVCLLVDCTGSMHWCIEAVKAKAREILELAPRVHPDAITRLAFVGYRDYGDTHSRFVVHDFVGKGDLHRLQALVGGVDAFGGADGPEDVAGALQKVLGLSWASSTRLLVHFADFPCHGTRYHSLADDSYPAGDPDGLVPEELLKKLVVNRVDYNFARITRHTDKMVDIFKKVYAESPGAATFETHECGASADRFVPLVVKSVTSSMRRSFRAGSGASSASTSHSSAAGAALALPAIYDRLV